MGVPKFSPSNLTMKLSLKEFFFVSLLLACAISVNLNPVPVGSGRSIFARGVPFEYSKIDHFGRNPPLPDFHGLNYKACFLNLVFWLTFVAFCLIIYRRVSGLIWKNKGDRPKEK